MSVTFLLETFGVAGVVAIVFAETGLLVGAFLPGDSLLFTAGLLASQHRLNLAVLIIGAVAAAIIGDQVGYGVGRRLGPKLFARPDARIFKQNHLTKASRFFERHGAKAVVVARFVPVVRTFTPTLAGAVHMPYRRFVTYNIVGGAVWASSIPIVGYTLGKTIPGIDRYLVPTIALIVVVSLVPIGVEAFRHRSATAS